jgi:type II secretory pathway component PulM
MNRRAILLGGGLLVCLILATAVWCQVLVSAARDERAAAEDRLRQVQTQATVVASLRQRHQAVTTTRRPDGDLIATIRTAAQGAGIPESAFQGVAPRDDRIAGDGSVRIQQVQVQWQGLNLGQVGAWLAALRSGSSPWRIGDIGMVHERHGVGDGADQADRYAVTVLLTAPYLSGGVTPVPATAVRDPASASAPTR